MYTYYFIRNNKNIYLGNEYEIHQFCLNKLLPSGKVSYIIIYKLTVHTECDVANCIYF